MSKYKDVIRSYIQQEGLAAGFEWLLAHSWAPVKGSFTIPGVDGTVHFNGLELKSVADADTPAPVFQFTTHLVFDIDPEIVAAIPHMDFPLEMDMTTAFPQRFHQLYLPEGKIKVGPFHVRLSKLQHSEVYELEFAPAFHERGFFSRSAAVKSWIRNFSAHARAILSFVDTSLGNHVMLYYRGYPVDFVIEEPEAISPFTGDFFNDCFRLTADKEVVVEQIRIFESKEWYVVVQDQQWIMVSMYEGIPDLVLNEAQVQQLQTAGRAAVDAIHHAHFIDHLKHR